MERRTWSSEEVVLLTERAASSPLKDIAAELNRPVDMVRWKARKLGLTTYDARKDNRGAPRSVWSPDRLQYLREHAATDAAADIAEHLGVDVRSVRTAMLDYGIEGRGRTRKQSPAEVERRTAPLRGRQKVDRQEPRECSRCHESKPVHQFPSEKNMESGLCKECRAEVRAERWAHTSDEERAVIYLRQRILAHGITVNAFDILWARQGGVCAVCKEPFLDPTKAEIDHDHRHCPGARGCSECVRGLLHRRCNIAVGWAEQFDADPTYLEAIAAYLARTASDAPGVV